MPGDKPTGAEPPAEDLDALNAQIELNFRRLLSAKLQGKEAFSREFRRIYGLKDASPTPSPRTEASSTSQEPNEKVMWQEFASRTEVLVRCAKCQQVTSVFTGLTLNRTCRSCGADLKDVGGAPSLEQLDAAMREQTRPKGQFGLLCESCRRTWSFSKRGLGVQACPVCSSEKLRKYM